MPERQSRHSDNDLIDAMRDEETPDQQGRAGGDVNKTVGTCAEKNRATDPEDTERATGSDNPVQDERKGPKTRAAIQSDRDD